MQHLLSFFLSDSLDTAEIMNSIFLYQLLLKNLQSSLVQFLKNVIVDISIEKYGGEGKTLKLKCGDFTISV